MASAATSLSRIATHARPTYDETRLYVIAVKASRTARYT